MDNEKDKLFQSIEYKELRDVVLEYMREKKLDITDGASVRKALDVVSKERKKKSMDNEKLLKERNEKLALWSGFRKVVLSGGASLILPNGEIQTNTYSTIHPNYPDFEKVDTCIKWLLSKIEDLDGVYFYPKLPTIVGGYYWIMNINGGVSFEGDTLAEAIEKYVDWVKENEGNA